MSFTKLKMKQFTDKVQDIPHPRIFLLSMWNFVENENGKAATICGEQQAWIFKPTLTMKWHGNRIGFCTSKSTVLLSTMFL